MADGARETTTDQLAGKYGPVAVRWLLGLLWLANLDWKVPNDFGGTPPGCAGFCGHVQAGVDHPVAPGSAWIFEHVIGGNIALFGWLALLVEVALATMLLSGRLVRVAAVMSMVQSAVIFLAVANRPGDWYWSYLLLFGLSLAVFVSAPDARITSPRIVAALTAVYGALVAVSHADAGLTGDGNATWSHFTAGRAVPDEFGRAVFPGSVLLGLGFVAVGGLAWLVAGMGTAVRRAAGWLAIGVATLLLLTYRDGTLAIGLGARATSATVLATVGLALIPTRS